MKLSDHLWKCEMRPLRDVFIPLSNDGIKEIEDEMGPFPSAYREMLSQYGCAVFDIEVYFTPIDKRFLKIAPEGWMTLDIIYGGIYDNDPWDPNSLRANIEWTKGRMPDTMIPIAGSGNDHICLGLGGADHDKVFYWDRENEPTTNYNNVYLVANSFSDFVLSLKCEICQ